MNQFDPRLSMKWYRRHTEIEQLEQRQLLAVAPIISEFVASNENSLLDENDDSPDWIEIHNAGDQSLNLQGWFLTDDANDLTKWRFPATHLAAGSFFGVFASGNDVNGTGPSGEHHTNFRLNANGEYLALVQPDGLSVASEYAPQFSIQFTDISYGRSSSGLVGYFREPTPGQPNVGSPLSNPQRELVISEIMYHPDSHDPLDEYIEIHNAGIAPVDLSGWRLSAGVNFLFPTITIQTDSHLVIAADGAQFVANYPTVTNFVAGWEGQLSNSGETVSLLDALGERVDHVEFSDEGDWAQRVRGPEDLGVRGWLWSDQHDGGGSSLELVNIGLPNDYGQNWAASSPGGTPGAPNSTSESSSAPIITDVVHGPIIPHSSGAVRVTAKLIPEAGAPSAELWWRVSGETEFDVLPMSDDGLSDDGTAGDFLFAAHIPPQSDGTVVEFFVLGRSGEKFRFWPAANEEGQTTNLLYQVDDAYDPSATWTPGSLNEYRQIMTVTERNEFATMDPRSDAQMNATFVAITGTGMDVRYNAGIRYRGSNSRIQRPNGVPPNNRINLPGDNPWEGITALNLNTIDVHNQIAGSALFRLAGLPAAEAKAVRMLSNGQDLYNGQPYVHLEPLNSEFAANQFPIDSNGNLYKGRRPNESPPGGLGAGLNYHGPDPAPYVSYQKLTNASAADYSDVINLTAKLNLTIDEEYATTVRQVVDVEQWMRFFAMNALLDNAEGALANGDPAGDDYATYRGIDDSRFVLIPHDLDSLFRNTGRGFFRAAGNPTLSRFFAQPEFLHVYYDQLRALVENVLLTDTASTTLDEALDHVLGEGGISSIKNFLATRSDFILERIPNTVFDITIENQLPVVGEFPRTTNSTGGLSGTAPPSVTKSVFVNGIPADSLGLDGRWVVGSGDLAGDLVLIELGDTWKYLDDGSDQGTSWRSPGFDDSNWESGPAPLGYGDDNEATVIDFVDVFPDSDEVQKNPTSYFRKSFTVDDPTALARLLLRMRYDDAAAVYINDTEVVRTDNLEPGATFDMHATFTRQNENNVDDFPLPESALALLEPGENTIAVEIHQASYFSSDTKLDLALLASVRDQVVESGIELRPGINRILVQAFDGIGGTGNELARESADIWFDDGTVQEASETLDGHDIVWNANLGPYHVTTDLVIPAGTNLTIEPGTTVYFDEDTSLTVSGQLIARGNEVERIRFTSVPAAPFVSNRPANSNGLPDGPPRWDGIHFVDSNSPENVIAYADFDYAEDLRGSIGIDHSQLLVDNVSFRGTHLRMIESNASSYVIRHSTFPDMFAENEVPAELGLDNISEHIHSVGIPPEGGQMLIQGNTFGTNKGHNDVIDANSGRRPGTVLQIIDNDFAGARDEELDLGGDVYVSGNVFRNIFKDTDTSDRGYANAISTGDAGTNTTIVVARNVFWNVDHAINLKRDTATIFENNTVVQVHDDFVDSFGNLNIGSAINFFVDEPGATSGDGAYVADNIFWDVPRVFGNADLPAGASTDLELFNNLLDPSLSSTTIGDRPGKLLAVGENNNLSGPGFVDADRGDFSLRPDSPARGAGTVGQDLGAMIRPGIWIAGEPPAMTGSRSATLTVGGPGIFAYRFRVNGGSWSADFPIGDGFTPENGTVRTSQITLNNLVDGSYFVEAMGQDFAGKWQEVPTISQTWQVDTSLESVVISEVLAKNFVAVEHEGTFPDLIELYNAGRMAVDLSGFALSDSPTNLNKFVFAPGAMIDPGGYLVLFADDNTNLPGIHLGFSLQSGGDGVYFSDARGTLLDQVEFGPQVRDLSIGRVGYDQEWRLTVPTFGSKNDGQLTGDPTFLKINEWLASGTDLFDEDFLELYNPQPLPVELSSLFLSDEPGGNPRQHEMVPLSYIDTSGYLRLISDANTDGGGDHLNFRLSASHELVAILDQDSNVIDQVMFFPQTSDVSQARSPNGGVDYEYSMVPTPGYANRQDDVITDVNQWIGLNDVWAYDQSGSDLGTSWQSTDFDDSAWPRGQAVLGDENEPLPSPVVTQLRAGAAGPRTFYFRRDFVIDGSPDDSTVQLETLIDDGAIFYVNGVEVFRLGMDEGPVEYQTLSNRFVNEAFFEGPFTLPSDAFQSGSNTVAVEVHQSVRSLPDVVFGIILEAVTTRKVATERDVSVSEIHYHPSELPDEVLSTEEMEFVELHNRTELPIDLSLWRLHEAVDFLFAENTSLSPKGQVVVVSFDPVAEPAKAAAFRAAYRISSAVQLFGPYNGSLNNRGETVEISRPVVDSIELGGYTRVDIVRYRDTSPWPNAADGSGMSLTRLDLDGIGSDPMSWSAEEPTPGNDEFSGLQGDIDLDGDIDAQDVDILFTAVDLGVVDPLVDLDANGVINRGDVDYLVRIILNTEYGDADLDGSVGFSDFNIVSNNFNTLQTGWTQGNFDGNNSTSFSDFIVLSTNFGFAGRTLAPEDADLDGRVEFGDFSTLAVNVGLLSQSDWRRGDFDLDGDVDFVDFSIFAAAFDRAVSRIPGDVDFSDFVALTNHFLATDAQWADGDFDQDQDVDFTTLANQWTGLLSSVPDLIDALFGDPGQYL